MCDQSCPILCDPMDCSPPDSSVHGIFQARILEWVVISYSRGSSWSRDQTDISGVSCIGGGILCEVKVTQSCPTLCDCMNCGLPGSSVTGVLQARILGWVAIPFSRDLSHPGIKPRSPTLQSESSPSEPPGKPWVQALGWEDPLEMGITIHSSILVHGVAKSRTRRSD